MSFHQEMADASTNVVTHFGRNIVTGLHEINPRPMKKLETDLL